MKQVREYEAIKVTSQKPIELLDSLVIEAPLQININRQPYTVVMRTPGDDNDLITGLLYAEDIYRKKQSPLIESIETNKFHNNILNARIPEEDLGKGYLNKRTLLSVSSCGICGKQELDDLTVSGTSLKTVVPLTSEDIQKMSKLMRENQSTFEVTGGSHACALFDSDKNILVIKEDIGRHNAVDKCVGNLISANQLTLAKIMLVSGRVSYEIVSKAFFAKIPVIVAVSACSTLAVDFAKEFGICLIGFNRQDKMTIYSNPQYLQ